MFCDKCGREIRHDSEYCSYCGAPVGSTEAQTSDSAGNGAIGSTADAHCVVPRAPKKHCLDCQKELPASSISDICALCSIRRRNRELEKDRADSDAAYAKLDRYDISDEFDQTVFAGNKYYKSNPDSEPLYRQRAESPHVSPFKRNMRDDERKGARSHLGFSWVAVVVVITAIGIFGNVSDFGGSDESTSVTAATEISMSETAHITSDWEALPPTSLSEDGSLTQTNDEGFVPTSYDDILMRVSEVTLYELNNLLTFNGSTPSDTSIGDGEFSYDGAYLNSKGTVFFTDGDNDEQSSAVFELRMMMTRNQYILLTASLGDVEQFDLRYAIASDGTLTEEGAAEISTESAPMYAGDDFFSDPVIFPDEFSQE